VFAQAAGRAWLAGLPAEVAAQRRLMTGLLEFCEAAPLVTSLTVGCSLGRGAADALSDVDAAIGLAAEPGAAGAAQVTAVEADLVAELPRLGAVVDVLRHRVGPPGVFVRRVFAQFADCPQLDVAFVAEAGVRRGEAAPDFVSLYQADGAPATGDHPSAYVVTGEQVREWAFHGWCALIDLAKYLRRDSRWEAMARLQEARHQIWALWAAAIGALYPWHGLSQVLDQDPANLPPGIEATVATLDAGQLLSAARASATVLAQVSAAAAERYPADLPDAMARYVTETLASL
jgi:hypothetical protein